MRKKQTWKGIRTVYDEEMDEILFLAEDTCKLFKVDIFRAFGLTIKVRFLDKRSCTRSDSNCGTPVFNKDGVRALCLMSKTKEAGLIKMIMTPHDLMVAGLTIDELNGVEQI